MSAAALPMVTIMLITLLLVSNFDDSIMTQGLTSAIAKPVGKDRNGNQMNDSTVTTKAHTGTWVKRSTRLRNRSFLRNQLVFGISRVIPYMVRDAA